MKGFTDTLLCIDSLLIFKELFRDKGCTDHANNLNSFNQKNDSEDVSSAEMWDQALLLAMRDDMDFESVIDKKFLNNTGFSLENSKYCCKCASSM